MSCHCDFIIFACVQVHEFEAKLAALADDLAAQKSATEAAARSAGDAAQQHVSDLQAQLEQVQIERDQMQTDVHSFEQQLHDQDQRYREVRLTVVLGCV